MAETGYVRMLRESLEKKVGVLMQIREMNRRQKDILENAISTPEELDENIAKKQELIDRLDQLDSGFQQMYERVRDLFRANPEEYKDEILKMKDLIREITDLSTRIQVEEKENKSLLEAKFVRIRKRLVLIIRAWQGPILWILSSWMIRNNRNFKFFSFGY